MLFRLVKTLFNSERFLFGILLLGEVVYVTHLLSAQLLSGGHDTFQYFTLQHFFLNHAVTTGEVPQWLPYMTQGTVSSWWYVLQAGFLQNALFLFAPLLKAVNFFYIFHLSFFVDELVLLVGCWLWGRRFLGPMGNFFFCVTTVTGAIWLNQLWYGMHIYFCIPLMIHFMHRFLEVGQWRYLALAGNLSILQMMGNLPYFFPVITFVTFLYFVFFLLFNRPVWRSFLNKLHFSGRTVLALLMIAVSCGLYYYIGSYGTESIVNYNLGRNVNSTAPIKDFLNYAGNANLNKWKELYLGFCPELDYTLYGGLLILPLILWIIPFFRRRDIYKVEVILPLLSIIAAVLMFSVGGLIAKVSYYVWPMMKFYRHIGLSATIAKLFVFLLAAYVWQWLYKDSLKITEEGRRRGSEIFLVIMLGIIAIGHLQLDRDVYDRHVMGMVLYGSRHLKIFEDVYLHFLFKRFAVVLILSFVLTALCLWWCWLKRGQARLAVFFLILLVHVVDLYMFKFYETKIRTVAVAGHLDTARFEPMPYVPRRDKDVNWQASPRAELIQMMPLYGVLYWSNNSFLYKDEPGSPLRVDHWLKPLDQMMRAYWGQDIDDTSKKPKGIINYRSLEFPMDHPAPGKMAGVTQDKIQFFSDVLKVPYEKSIATLIQMPEYQGDIPLVLDPQTSADLNRHLGDNARLTVPYQVTRFEANRLTLNVEAPRAVWLHYSDVWHEGWRAYVDEKQVPVARSNLAYKIIPVPSGTHTVRFEFFSPWVALAQKILSLNALAWLVGFGILIAGVLRKESDGRPEASL